MAIIYISLGALYHTKDYQGTTTSGTFDFTRILLYHTKDYQGTTTHDAVCV